MCIRDRGVEDGVWQVVLGSDVTGALAEGSNRLDIVAVSKPVSYTHLRAHETVLDLVCRLLLEKTNT